MKGKKMEVKVDFSTGQLVINGERYVEDKIKNKKEGKTTHSEFSVFRKLDEEKYNKLKDEIKEHLREKIDMDRVLDEILKRMPIETMNKIRRMLRKNAKVKTHDGCYGIDIDSGSEHEYISLFD